MRIEARDHDRPTLEETKPQRLVGGALLRYYCVAHRSVAGDRAPVTIYRSSWAYCVSGYGGRHEWIPMEPISHANLRSFGPTFLDHVDELVPA